MIGGHSILLRADYGWPPHFHELKEKEKEMGDNNKAVGRIIKVSKAGWGFISSKEIEFTRIFFHWTSLKQDTLPFLQLKTGMHVEFTPIQIQGKGFRAIHVKVIDKREKEDATPTDVPVLSE